jgi:hypothetical protein
VIAIAGLAFRATVNRAFGYAQARTLSEPPQGSGDWWLSNWRD